MLYRVIFQQFWSDPKVIDDMTPEDRYIFLYLLTNEHTKLSGCYEYSIRQMANETGYNRETLERILDKLTGIGVISVDKATKEVLIVNFHKYNWNSSPKMLAGVAKTVPYIKSQVFRDFVNQKIKSKRDGTEDTVSIPYDNDMDTSVTVPVTVPEPVSENKAKKSDNCPYEEIVALYTKLCPGLKKVRNIGKDRKRNIHARWEEYGRDIDIFREVFEKASATTWMYGFKDNPSWKAGLDYLLEPKKFRAVLESEPGKEVKNETYNTPGTAAAQRILDSLPAGNDYSPAF